MVKKTIGVSLFIIGLGTLLFLGSWQIQRLQWKNNIIEQLNAEYAQDPATQIFNFTDLAILTHQETPLKYGSIKGTYLHNKGILLGPKTKDGVIGFHIITPIKTRRGVTLVNRGFVSKSAGEADTFPKPRGLIKISGLIRKPDWNKFTPENSPENNIWIRPDITEIADAKNLSPIAPVMVYEGTEKWYPRNKHLQYALFWLTLALIWSGLGIYLNLSKQARDKD